MGIYLHDERDVLEHFRMSERAHLNSFSFYMSQLEIELRSISIKINQKFKGCKTDEKLHFLVSDIEDCKEFIKKVGVLKLRRFFSEVHFLSK